MNLSEKYAPVTERVSEVLRRALALITEENGYNWTVNKIFRDLSISHAESLAPALCLIGGNVRALGEVTQGTFDLLYVARPFEVHYFIPTTEDFSQDTWAELMAADIYRALMPRDVNQTQLFDTWGGGPFPIEIEFGSERPFNSEIYMPRAHGRVQFEVQYQFMRSDPRLWNQNDALVPVTDLLETADLP